MIYWCSGRQAPPSRSVTAGVLIRVTVLLLSAGAGLVRAYSEQNYLSFQAVCCLGCFPSLSVPPVQEHDGLLHLQRMVCIVTLKTANRIR